MGLRAFLLLDATFAMCGATFAFGVARRHSLIRHPGEGRDLTLSVCRTGEIPAFAGMTIE